MLIIIFRRLLQAILVLLFVALISFLIFRFVGNPVESLLGQEATVAQRAALEEALGLNDPIHIQYADFVWRALQFDFLAIPIEGHFRSRLILLRLPATLELALTSAIFALVFGVIAGIYTAINKGSFFNKFHPFIIPYRGIIAYFFNWRFADLDFFC